MLGITSPTSRILLAAAALVVLLAVILPGLRPQSRIATTAAEVCNRKAAKSGSLPAARIDGVVTYSDPANGLLFVQDSTGGVRVSVGATDNSIRLVIGSPFRGWSATQYSLRSFSTRKSWCMAPGPFPGRPRLLRRRSVRGRWRTVWSTVEGVVQRADTIQNGIALVVRISQGGTPIDVYCQDVQRRRLTDELDRRVRVMGVATSDLDVELKPVGRTIWSVAWANTVHLDPVRSPGSAPLASRRQFAGHAHRSSSGAPGADPWKTGSRRRGGSVPHR